MRAAVTVRENRAALVEEAARWFVRGVAATVAAQGRCTVALSGGNTPTPLYELLASPPWRQRVSWPHLHLFWVDERFVPADDARSNYGVVRRVLLPHAGIPPENVHPVPIGAGTPEQAALLYDQTIRRLVAGGRTPALDLVFLGLGDDGHTASLFPDSALLRVEDRLVAADPLSRAGTSRITMTVPLLNAALQIIFLVSGASRAAVGREVLVGERDPDRLPAQLVRPSRGSVRWLMDRAAAAQLALPGASG